jgi:DNA-binding NarL/FixJ family response regulator
MTILFLDSQTTTRAERSSALSRQLDWDVTTVASLAEARAWLAQTKTLDLLITEAIIDAQNSGFDLRDAALARFPEARVLFTHVMISKVMRLASLAGLCYRTRHIPLGSS